MHVQCLRQSDSFILFVVWSCLWLVALDLTLLSESVSP